MRWNGDNILNTQDGSLIILGRYFDGNFGCAGWCSACRCIKTLSSAACLTARTSLCIYCSILTRMSSSFRCNPFLICLIVSSNSKIAESHKKTTWIDRWDWYDAERMSIRGICRNTERGREGCDRLLCITSLGDTDEVEAENVNFVVQLEIMKGCSPNTIWSSCHLDCTRRAIFRKPVFAYVVE